MNPEGTALADRAVYADATTVHLCDVFDDGEAEAGATHFNFLSFPNTPLTFSR